ncbi:MSC_0624 family F1-like ATPase-associated membrane protein [Mesomycoplasma neurolyticum]|uniref:Uncharacterized protein n=1 Tax=Mesomycoplasma neurolyticum TaxID=2120 RepID=A0A449A4M9_9BACT|nr:hypothetical protein [Mesomycoplasma neurolyticum]VEU59186.1 Uncharacterised protein [Mesomycoplasma neurolyticum]
MLKLLNHKQIFKNNKNLYFVTLRYLLLILLAIGTFLIFVLSDKTLFYKIELKEKLFDFSDYKSKIINFVFIFYTFILFYIFYSSIIKNFLNLNNYKETIHKYFLWFLCYFIFSITSLILIFAFHPLSNIEEIYENKKSFFNIFYFIFLLIFYIFLNIGFSFFNLFLNWKISPLSPIKKWMIIVSSIAKIILISVFTIILFLIMKNTNENNIESLGNQIFKNNKTYNFFENLFFKKTTLNIFIIITLISLLIIMLILMNIEKIFLIITKQFSKIHFKNIIIIFFAIKVPLILMWIINLATIKEKTVLLIEQKNTNFLLPLIHFFVILFFIGIYFFINLYFKNIISAPLIKKLLYTSIHLLIWIETFIILFFVNSNEISIISTIYLLSGLLSLIVVIFHAWQNNRNSNQHWFTTILFLKLFLLIIFIENLNLILVYEANNFIFNELFNTFNTNEIIMLFIILLWIIYLFYIVIEFLLIKFNITKKIFNLKRRKNV